MKTSYSLLILLCLVYAGSSQKIAPDRQQYTWPEIVFKPGLRSTHTNQHNIHLALTDPLGQSTDYTADSTHVSWLRNLHRLSEEYNRIGEYGLCSQINELGISECLKMDELHTLPYFIQSEGINQYCKKNYKSSIVKLKKVIPDFIANTDLSAEITSYVYIGKSYWSMNNCAAAVQFFTKADQVAAKLKSIHPDLRENYGYLIDYYKQQNDLGLQLHHLKKLLAHNRLLDEKHLQRGTFLLKDYEAQLLLREKKRLEMAIEKKSNDRNYSLIAFVFTFLAATCLARKYLSFYPKWAVKFANLYAKVAKPGLLNLAKAKVYESAGQKQNKILY